MKVILLMDVKGTGKKDQIVEASDGFARNYLIPRKMAKEATAEALNAISRAKSADKHREDVRRAEAEQRARELKGKVVQLTVRGGENGKLYGAVTNDQIAAALKEQFGIEIDKRKIEQEEPVRSAGQTAVTLKLMAGVSARVLLNVKVVTK
ncbi:MAG TPA: 50S ribosomal protein L9 [Candidatus Faecivicinus avistercoris]|nr:50S ribosomal protein L9 [Candidatus Faecivicinus avistercoris]